MVPQDEAGQKAGDGDSGVCNRFRFLGSATLWVSISLVLIVALKPLLQGLHPEIDWYCVIFCALPAWPWDLWAIFTNSFGHQGWSHLFQNLPFVLGFGWPVEKHLGRRAWFWFFMLGGGLSGVAQWAITGKGALGASGAAAGLLALLLMVWAPRTRWITRLSLDDRRPWLTMIGTWAVGFFVGWLVIAIWNPIDGIGHWAHFFGYLFGSALGVAHERESPSTPWRR